jgi:two-component system, cell cycle sensor histidine kinase and response regulator CckA
VIHRSRPERVLLPIALAGLGLVAYSAYRSWEGFEQANREALVSRSVLDHTSRLLAAVTDAETGQRGYLLTGKVEYLEPFTNGEQTAPTELGALEQIAPGRRDLAKPVARLAPIVRLKLTELQRSIDIRKRRGAAAAIEFVGSDMGREAMNTIRALCADITNAEYERWQDESVRRQNEGRWSLAVTVSGALTLAAVLALALLLIHRATTQRERLIGQLHERGELLQTTLASIGDAVVVTDERGEVTFLNGVAQHLTGYSNAKATGLPIEKVLRLVSEQTGAPVENPAVKVLRSGTIFGLASGTALLRGDGSQVPIADSAAPIRGRKGTVHGVVLVFRDISEARAAEAERRLMDERLQEAAKLESLGVLAGGIAHDFNNLLVGILGNASLALDALPGGSDLRPMMEQVVTAAQRAADLTRQMLAYAGKGQFFVERLRLRDVIRETLPLIQSSIPRTVKLEVDTQEESEVEGDATQLQQIVMNLVINAGEACADRGGTVSVATHEVQIAPGDLPAVVGADEIEPGDYVALEVRDTGSGMDAKTMQRIFEPFFTTKFTGRGLGLAAVMGIVRSHRGGLHVESRPGQGSTFRVLLPAAVKGRRPLVVVADGESSVRNMARAALERVGYEVVAAATAAEAAALSGEHAGRLVAVIVEGAPAEVADVRRALPGVPIIVASGRAEDQVRHELNGLPVDGFLAKPYTAGRLWEKVKAVAR